MKIVGVIPGFVEEQRYRRFGRYTGPYKHRFRTLSMTFALRDGTLWTTPVRFEQRGNRLLISQRRGRKLWVRLP